MIPTAVLERADRTAARLSTVGPVVLGRDLRREESDDVGTLYDALVRSVRAEPTTDRVWLLYCAVTARFPDVEEVHETRRVFELEDQLGVATWLLERAVTGPGDTLGWGLELLRDQVVVDVDFSARHELHTGIQRVVRSTLPHWAHRPDVVPVVWTPASTAYRRCSPEESARVLRWGEQPHDVPDPATVPRTPDAVGDDPAAAEPDADPTAADTTSADSAVVTAPEPEPDVPTLLVPWDCRVVLLEVPPRPSTGRLAALAQFSRNHVSGVGYDCIPIVSGLLLPAAEPDKFVDYLSVVKHMDHIAGISSSATLEFRGYTDMLVAQGLVGPDVSECALPVAGAHPVATEPEDLPSVLCVGSFEPRKNQEAVLYAAEVLWREGLRFRLRFVGGGGWGAAFPRQLRRLRRRGRPVEQLTAISEAELARAYAVARFTVFVSLHEGYGLPVAESFAHGVPALVTGYGSVAEIGAEGGGFAVDPRDDDALVAGMRRLLTDDVLLARLRQEIAARPTGSWSEYADQLWSRLVDGARA